MEPTFLPASDRAGLKDLFAAAREQGVPVNKRLRHVAKQLRMPPMKLYNLMLASGLEAMSGVREYYRLRPQHKRGTPWPKLGF